MVLYVYTSIDIELATPIVLSLEDSVMILDHRKNVCISVSDVKRT